jgi:hypothetical protein
VYHSPTGFETGYAGRGPADLALSILADHFDAAPEQIAHVTKSGFGGNCLNAEKAVLYHQCVKFRFVAPSDRALKPGEQYTITSREIEAYLAEILRRRDPEVA